MYEEVSQLLKEAKPLYIARKRRNNRIKSGAAMLACVAVLAFFRPQQEDYSYYADYGDNYWYSTDNTTSVIENMGLPTDEYGLLMVG